ncbi:hypothetical protein [Actinoplanes regularis]|uniref:Uncharacterized protein n=1 Tax=Actinoplanes regularis TaxID=52697 RepID=A0A238XV78_9ACTN|nr:hypothetical protein [Actinoplanes regularis]GIE87755.1 hypothetical protein Are01nite_42350 [Actinoplanes regularis]GLW28109.1 hypothetical protein Areg01_10490 [Actinoplanes regularis]SNR62642.1 hypothetical protein SAMN06264365_10433 [Actinoplanes regularis]
MSDLQPVDFERADYRTVLRRLTTLDQRAAGLRAEAVEWHATQRASADEAVQAAEEQVRVARRAARDARRELEEVDARAAGLWADYAHRAGPVAERFGSLPPASIPRQRDDQRAAEDYLAEVEKRIKWTDPARPLTFGVKVLFGVFGVVGGILGAIGNQVLRGAGAASAGDWHEAAPVVALLVLLACPVLAVVLAKLVADRRKVGLDTATVVTVLVTGLVTAMLLFTATQYAGH